MEAEGALEGGGAGEWIGLAAEPAREGAELAVGSGRGQGAEAIERFRLGPEAGAQGDGQGGVDGQLDGGAGADAGGAQGAGHGGGAGEGGGPGRVGTGPELISLSVRHPF